MFLKNMNTQKAVENYIAEHPSIKDCLKKGLINYSKLSRLIADKLKIKKKSSFDAILIACRRYYDKIKKEKTLEAEIIDVVKKSKLEIKNKVVAIVIEKKAYFDNILTLEKEIKKKNEPFHIVEGSDSYTVITTSDFLDKIKELFKHNIKKINTDLIEIIIKSPRQIESTPGVISYLYSLFGENGINIVETMSCWTDTIFLIEQKDFEKVSKILKIL